MELVQIEAELARRVEAISDAGPLATILAAIKAREQRRAAIRAELKSLAAQKRVEVPETSEIKTTLATYLEDWRTIAREGIAEARRASCTRSEARARLRCPVFSRG